MKEILFKAKRIDNGEWVEGYLYRLSERLNPFIMMKNRHGYAHEVDPATVCQFTGLTDKNGEKIFEGDVCLLDESHGVVRYEEDDAMFTFTYDENINVNFGQIRGTELEVIGNIHDEEAKS